jgi:hypothetical protein
VYIKDRERERERKNLQVKSPLAKENAGCIDKK